MQRLGLDSLASWQLSPAARTQLDQALVTNAGSAPWRKCKAVNTQGLLALSEIAPAGRMSVLSINLAEELRAVIRLRVPVAWRESDQHPIRIAAHAVLGLLMPEQSTRVPSAVMLEVISPPGAWHPAIASIKAMPGVMCLGNVPLGARATDYVLLAYAGLAMQGIDLRAFESLGVMNTAAARDFAERMHELPLSKTAFLEIEEELKTS